MIDQSQNAADNIVLCPWCGIALGSANLFKSPICVRCYQILTTANLSDDEIFGDKNTGGGQKTAAKGATTSRRGQKD